MKKKICILYTGGTIGMVPTDKGYAPKRGYFHDAISSIDDLKGEGMPEWEQTCSCHRLTDSALSAQKRRQR